MVLRRLSAYIRLTSEGSPCAQASSTGRLIGPPGAAPAALALDVAEGTAFPFLGTALATGALAGACFAGTFLAGLDLVALAGFAVGATLAALVAFFAAGAALGDFAARLAAGAAAAAVAGALRFAAIQSEIKTYQAPKPRAVLLLKCPRTTVQGQQGEYWQTVLAFEQATPRHEHSKGSVVLIGSRLVIGACTCAGCLSCTR